MKKILKFNLIILTMVLFIASCKKEGEINPLSSYSNFKQGALWQLRKVINANLDFTQLATSTVGIRVSKYNNGTEFDEISLYVSPTATLNFANWKLVSTQKFTADSIDLTCTGAQLATALGVNISSFGAGNQFFFYVSVKTKEGLTYDVRNMGQSLVGDPGSGGCSNCGYGVRIGSQSSVQWTAFITCPYIPDDLFGVGNNSADFEVIADGWEDWGSGSVVTVYRGSKANPALANTISLTGVYGSQLHQANPAPGSYKELLVNLDPASGTASIPGVPAVQYSTGGTIYWGRGAGGSDTAPSGYVFSCTGYIGVNINWYGSSLSGTNFGAYRLTLQKL